MSSTLLSTGSLSLRRTGTFRPAAAQPSSRPRVWRGVCRAQSDDLGDLDKQLQEDLQRLRQKQAAAGGLGGSSAAPARGGGGGFAGSASGSASGGSAAAESEGGVKELLDKFLIADFFFILFALAWFAVGLVQRSATQSTGVLDAWYSLWQLVFQPALGVLMLGAIVSGVTDWVSDNLGGKGK